MYVDYSDNRSSSLSTIFSSCQKKKKKEDEKNKLTKYVIKEKKGDNEMIEQKNKILGDCVLIKICQSTFYRSKKIPLLKYIDRNLEISLLIIVS